MSQSDNAPQASKTYERVKDYLNTYTTYAGQAPGNTFFVDSGNSVASTTTDGLSKDTPRSTIESCFTPATALVTANNGDIIYVMPGHTEAVVAAGGLDLDVAGVTIAFLGEGESQARITFGTTSTADMDIDAASITLIRPKFVAAVDALAGPIDVNATDFTIVDGQYRDATNIDTTDCVVATAGATRLRIHGWKYLAGNEGGTQKESNIQLNGVDDAELVDIDILGDFNAGNIENVTDECLNIRLRDVRLVNTNSDPSPCMVLDSNCDGVAERVLMRVASGSTYVSDLSDINWYECYGTGTDGASFGDAVGSAVAAGLEGKIDIIDAYHDVATADTSDNAVMSDVVGNKSDAAAAGAVTTRQLVGGQIVIDAFHDVPVADTSDNAQISDVVGNKSDAAAAGAVTTSESLMAYAKQIVGGQIVIDAFHDVPVADTSDNAQISDVVGNKTDAAAAGTVTGTESLMAYGKQGVNLADSMHKDRANYLTVTASMSSATWNIQAAHEIAVVTGMVRLRVLPEVTANLAGAATTISLGTANTVAGFIAATTGTELDATEIWQSSTPANNVPYIAEGSIVDYVVNSDDVGYTIAGGSATGGQIIFHIWWEPLNATGAVAAGAGGAF
jgi:hypothetical protein